MRSKISISLMLAFTFIVLNAYAILSPYDVSIEGGKSLAEELINATRSGGVLRLVDPTMPPTPQMSRALREQNLEWTPTLVWTPMPGLLATHTTPRASRTESRSQVDENSAALMSDSIGADSSVGNQNPIPVSSSDLAGTWFLNLNDTSSKQVELTLFQVEDKIFGSGNMKNGNDTLVVAASGTLKNDQIYLDITSISTLGLYSLAMTSFGDRRESVRGDYKAYMPDARTWIGDVQGRRTLPTS